MKKGEIKNPAQVWELLDQGTTVYWGNKAYKVYVDPNPYTSPYHATQARQFSTRNEEMLCVRCISNYFGGALTEKDLNELFTEEQEA